MSVCCELISVVLCVEIKQLRKRISFVFQGHGYKIYSSMAVVVRKEDLKNSLEYVSGECEGK